MSENQFDRLLDECRESAKEKVDEGAGDTYVKNREAWKQFAENYAKKYDSFNSELFVSQKYVGDHTFYHDNMSPEEAYKKDSKMFIEEIKKYTLMGHSYPSTEIDSYVRGILGLPKIAQKQKKLKGETIMMAEDFGDYEAWENLCQEVGVDPNKTDELKVKVTKKYTVDTSLGKGETIMSKDDFGEPEDWNDLCRYIKVDPDETKDLVVKVIGKGAGT